MSAVDEYLAGVSAPQKKELERVRKITRAMIPDLEEAISYGIPVFKYKKQPVIWFAAYKNHMSIYPAPAAVAALKEKLTPFKVSKGTIQFTLDNTLPESTLREIIKIRLAGIK